jgi:hypothetical protein
LLDVDSAVVLSYFNLQAYLKKHYIKLAPVPASA